jgi:hypothetical protein
MIKSTRYEAPHYGISPLLGSQSLLRILFLNALDLQAYSPHGARYRDKTTVTFTFRKSVIVFTYFNRRMANENSEVNAGNKSPDFMRSHSLREYSFDFFTVVPK